MKFGRLWGMAVVLVVSAYGAPELEFEKSDNFAKNRRVAVVNFAVEYQNHLVNTQTRFGSTSSSTTVLTLDGVSKEALQKETEKLYQQFLKELAASGVEVVPMEEIKKQEVYERLKRGASTEREVGFRYKDSSSFENSKALVFSPVALPYHPEADHERAGRFVGFSTGGETFSDIMANHGTRNEVEAELAKSLNATLLKVYYVVGFGEAKASVSERIGFNFLKEQNEKTTTHNQQTSSELFLYPEDTRFSLRVPDTSSFSWSSKNVPARDGNAFIRLKERVAAGANFAVDKPQNTNSTDTNLGNAVSALGSIALGMMGNALGGSANKQEFTVKADEKSYLNLSSKLISEVQSSFIQKLKAGQ